MTTEKYYQATVWEDARCKIENFETLREAREWIGTQENIGAYKWCIDLMEVEE